VSNCRSGFGKAKFRFSFKDNNLVRVMLELGLFLSLLSILRINTKDTRVIPG